MTDSCDVGRGTQWIAGLKVGDTVSMREHPKKDIDVVAAGRPIVMVAGGSGIAPMVQILNHFHRDPTKFPSLVLYFGGMTEQDLYYKELIDDLASKHADKLKVVYSVENPSENWTASKGYTNVELIQSLIPAQDTNPLLIVSGPPRMMVEMVGEKKLKKQGVLGGWFGKIGFTRKSVWTLW
jgi:cytochrome-b5 reductase